MERQHKRHQDASTAPSDQARPVTSSHAQTSIVVHLLNVSWMVATPFIVFVFGGIFLDNRLETNPLYTMIGLAFAVALMTRVVYIYVEKHYPGTFKLRK